jgi:DNA-binding transcriptional MerR regulator
VTAQTQEAVTYTTVEVCRLAKATFRQIDYWCRLGILQPAYIGEDPRYPGGSGHYRRFSAHEALKAAAVARMLTDGISFDVAKQLVAKDQWGELVVRPLPGSEVAAS